MKHQKRETDSKKIADEILHQIGGSVILVLLFLAVAAIGMVGWLSISSKKKELVQESNAAANQLTGFLNGYTKSMEQLAVNPQIKDVMRETKSGGDLWQSEKMETVMDNLVKIANTDTENVMSAWISDLDSSTLAQSDGFNSEEGWDITGRGWYPCIENKETFLTEPYVDSSTEKIILSIASPVIDDETGAVLGAVGVDLSLEHMTEIMEEYKIGRNGYILLMSEKGTFLYHPDGDVIQKNIKETNIVIPFLLRK